MPPQFNREQFESKAFEFRTGMTCVEVWDEEMIRPSVPLLYRYENNESIP
jgi:hypothetical protein